MKLYHFPSPNPQKVTFALGELGLECEMVPLDLAKGEQRKPEFLAINPFGRVPVLVDGDLTLWDSHAILAYLGEKTGKMWPTSMAGRVDALRWLFFLSGHLTPPAGEMASRIRSKALGLPPDEAMIARGEKALPAVLGVRSDGCSSCRGTSLRRRVKWPAAFVRRRWGCRPTKR